MKKRLSHFPYNERSRPGWTPSNSLRKPLSPILSTMKTVTYVPGTFVTLVPGPYIPRVAGEDEGGGFNGLNCLNGLNEMSRIVQVVQAIQKVQYVPPRSF